MISPTTTPHAKAAEQASKYRVRLGIDRPWASIQYTYTGEGVNADSSQKENGGTAE